MDEDMLGISPEILEQARKVGEYVAIEIHKHRQEGRVEVRYIPIDPSSYLDVGRIVDELSAQLAWGHATAFGMKGTITDDEN